MKMTLFATILFALIALVFLIAPEAARRTERKMFPSEAERMDRRWGHRPHFRFRVTGIIFAALAVIGAISLGVG